MATKSQVKPSRTSEKPHSPDEARHPVAAQGPGHQDKGSSSTAHGKTAAHDDHKPRHKAAKPLRKRKDEREDADEQARLDNAADPAHARTGDEPVSTQPDDEPARHEASSRGASADVEAEGTRPSFGQDGELRTEPGMPGRTLPGEGLPEPLDAHSLPYPDSSPPQAPSPAAASRGALSGSILLTALEAAGAVMLGLNVLTHDQGGAPAGTARTLDVLTLAGPLRSAVKVEVFDAQGRLLGTAVSDAAGHAVVALDGSYTGPVLVKSSPSDGQSFAYLDEASGQTRQYTGALRAMAVLGSDGTMHVRRWRGCPRWWRTWPRAHAARLRAASASPCSRWASRTCSTRPAPSRAMCWLPPGT